MELPDPKFIMDIATNFNRLGIIYHLPPNMHPFILQKYHKFTNQYR